MINIHETENSNRSSLDSSSLAHVQGANNNNLTTSTPKQTIFSKLKLESPRSGGSNYFILRFLLDSMMVMIWIIWTGAHMKSIGQLLCPPYYTDEYCSAQSSGAFASQLWYFLVLVPLALVYIFFIVMIRKKAKRNQKFSHYLTWSLFVLISHIYFCVLFGLHGSNVGLSFAYFGLAGIFIGIIPDIFFIWRFSRIRREQKLKEDSEYHLFFSTRHQDLIATNVI
ncbi:hypothetical protein C9374_004069 [Naegleria lovaniensis]|uniref:Uncharacterized protein n=1 Tax=Naegleria lovaniensis TaxID=51637 RepID=A0AA88GSL0_NAELO|nr:uncharacterized protein C9374_004069 [Naegleria lovaniensis]KAG2383398.1 hypothetical protein C9374_004069 [Naegleria lovaniensis]